MASLDTNILLRLILKDVPHQLAKAEALIKTNKTLTINDLAITETVFVLEKVVGHSRADIAKLITALTNNQYLEINRLTITKTLNHYLTYPALSFNDCYLAIAAQQASKTPLYTFDKALAKNLPKLASEF